MLRRVTAGVAVALVLVPAFALAGTGAATHVGSDTAGLSQPTLAVLNDAGSETRLSERTLIVDSEQWSLTGVDPDVPPGVIGTPGDARTGFRQDPRDMAGLDWRWAAPDEWQRAVSADQLVAADVSVQPVAAATETPVPTSDSSGGAGTLAVVVAIVVLLGIVVGFAWLSGAVPLTISPLGSASSEEVVSTASTDVSSPDGSAEPQEKARSDEDRVMELLEANDGRMKQVRIVEETDWSKSKVSMLLSDMEDDGEISKLRVGRENIISKAGEEPDAVGSPFDDE